MSTKYYTVCIIQKEKYENCNDLPLKYTTNGNMFNFIF